METSDVVGEGGSVQQRRPDDVVVKTQPLGRVEETVAAVELPAATTPLGIGIGFLSVGNMWHDEPRITSHQPPPLFIAQRNGGPRTIDRLGALDQGTDQGPTRLLGPTQRRST
jgi:hypothetical protein